MLEYYRIKGLWGKRDNLLLNVLMFSLFVSFPFHFGIPPVPVLHQLAIPFDPDNPISYLSFLFEILSHLLQYSPYPYQIKQPFPSHHTH